MAALAGAIRLARLPPASFEEYAPRAVALGRLVTVFFVALVTLGVAAGCGGDSGGGGVMRATLTGDGCRYEGSTTPAPGTFAVDVRNETSKPVNFQLMMLPTNATLQDVEAWFVKARQTWDRTGKYPLHPITWVSNTLVAPHAASELPANVSQGKLAVLCAPAVPRPVDVIAATELDVSS